MCKISLARCDPAGMGEDRGEKWSMLWDISCFNVYTVRLSIHYYSTTPSQLRSVSKRKSMVYLGKGHNIPNPANYSHFLPFGVLSISSYYLALLLPESCDIANSWGIMYIASFITF
jgi:hypothetical protein